MPRLEENLWIEGGYYVDFDVADQFRIIGPANALYCGLIDIPRHKIKIHAVESRDGTVVVRGAFVGSGVNIYYPAMDDIRTLRGFIEGTADHYVTFLEIRREHPDQMVPTMVEENKPAGEHGETRLVFRRNYEDKWYECIFSFPSKFKVLKINTPYKGFRIEGEEQKIPFNIIARTNDENRAEITNILQPCEIDFSVFKEHEEEVKNFIDRTTVEITHLLTWHKTSGDRFGTIFPRDWMEAADLGVHDLTLEARQYMYQASLRNVNDKGEGWHEDVVGEYKYEHELAGQDILDRKMIDIEPHYLMGLKKFDKSCLEKKECLDKLHLVANYVLKQAKEKELIVFKEMPLELQKKLGHKYWEKGDWRDSDWAYKKVAALIAPFSVNAVFYSEALIVLKDWGELLGVKIDEIDSLIKKWLGIRQRYQFKNADGLGAYALALYQKERKWEMFKVNHLDESYLYTYGEAEEREIVSFCKRLLDKNYFYTKSGPTLVALNNNYGYTNQEYHGLVIWTKQVAFTILGLSKHLKKAMVENWSREAQKLIKMTMLKICEDMVTVFCKLKAIPELHYDDNGEPTFFVMQGKMSKVQLWSAVGARRIFRKYSELMIDPKYRDI